MPDLPIATGYATTPWPFVSAVLLLLAGGAVAWAAALWWTHRLIHRPPRMTPGRCLVRLGRAAPDDVGLGEYRETTFTVGGEGRRPRATLVAWVIEPDGGDGRTVLLQHGYGESRAAALPWALAWHAAGWRVVLPDLRAHGESGGAWAGAGVWEADDADEVLNDLRAELDPPMLAVAGTSYGALIAATVAGRRDDLDAVVLDSPVRDWPEAVRRWRHLFALPPARAEGPRAWLTRRLVGVDPPPDATAAGLAAASCRSLVILPREDALLDPADGDQLAAMATEVWRPETSHNRAVVDFPEEYRKLAASLATRAGDARRKRRR